MKRFSVDIFPSLIYTDLVRKITDENFPPFLKKFHGGYKMIWNSFREGHRLFLIFLVFLFSACHSTTSSQSGLAEYKNFDLNQTASLNNEEGEEETRLGELEAGISDGGKEMKPGDLRAIIEYSRELYRSSISSWEKGDDENANNLIDKALAILLANDFSAKEGLEEEKMQLRTDLAKLILTIRSSSTMNYLGNSDEIPLIKNKYVDAEIKRFQYDPRARYFFEHAYKRSF